MIGYVIAVSGDPSHDLAIKAAASIKKHAGGKLMRDVMIVDDFDGRGYSWALNEGLRRFRHRPDIVCYLNSDVLMTEPDWKLLQLFAENPDLAVVGPRQIDRRGRLVHAGIVPEEDGGSVWDLDLRHRHWHHLLTMPDAAVGSLGIREVPMVSGAVMYVSTSWLDKVGGWPEWTRFYYEDAWVCYRARQLGAQVVYCGDVTWTHFHEEGSGLDRVERIDRLRYAREKFIYNAGRVGIPLRFPERIV